MSFNRLLPGGCPAAVERSELGSSQDIRCSLWQKPSGRDSSRSPPASARYNKCPRPVRHSELYATDWSGVAKDRSGRSKPAVLRSMRRRRAGPELRGSIATALERRPAGCPNGQSQAGGLQANGSRRSGELAASRRCVNPALLKNAPVVPSGSSRRAVPGLLAPTSVSRKSRTSRPSGQRRTRRHSAGDLPVTAATRLRYRGFSSRDCSPCIGCGSAGERLTCYCPRYPPARRIHLLT